MKLKTYISFSSSAASPQGTTYIIFGDVRLLINKTISILFSSVFMKNHSSFIVKTISVLDYEKLRVIIKYYRNLKYEYKKLQEFQL